MALGRSWDDDRATLSCLRPERLRLCSIARGSDGMADLKMRPRFAVEVSCDAETVVWSLREHIGDADPPLEGYFDRAHCVLGIPASRRHAYSPELDVTFEAIDSGGSWPGGVRVRCLLGPRPAIWTGFVFVYIVLGLLGVGGGLYGLAQLSLGEPGWFLFAPLAALALIGGVYGSTFIGQGLAATQMYELRRYLDECLERAEERAHATPRTPLDSAKL
jgi:hypothetical protein